ncbi:MAG: DNA repair protein RecO [bacterium]|nr:DNA repair protein RecO [bacterium]
MSRPERAFRTPCLIVKRRDIGEADRVLTILTPRHGKIDVVAKGARKLTSHKTGHVELFTRADMLIHKGREMGIAVQAEMVEPYLKLREDLRRGAYANYAAELLDRFTLTGDEEAGGLFRLFDATLSRLCSEADPLLALRYYEMHLLDQVGFRPELNGCAVGREPVLAEDQFFSYVDGGVVCARHATQASASVPISVTALKLLRHLQRSAFDAVRGLRVPESVHHEADRLMIGYLTYLLERRLQSVDFIRRLRFLA